MLFCKYARGGLRCLCVLLVIYCVTLYELCLCGCGCVCVCLFNVRVCCDCELLCDDACWIMCVAVRIRCLMRSRVVCDVVWLYGLLFVFVLLCVCALFTCVNVVVVACVYL